MKNKIAAIISIGALIGMAFSVYFYFEGRYALAQDVQRIEQRLDYKIKQDQLRSVQDRIWVIEDRSKGKPPTDQTVKEELNRLQEDKKHLENELLILQKK